MQRENKKSFFQKEDDEAARGEQGTLCKIIKIVTRYNSDSSVGRDKAYEGEGYTMY